MQTTYIIIFFLILFPRLIFIYFFPASGGDYEIYSTVAQNILNGCGVSLSNPLDSDCVPHFGGNHGPGYPFFVALSWSIFNYSDNMVRIIQSLIYSFSCIWLLRSVYLITQNKKIFIYFGIMLAFSPLLIAWPRYVQTETLSLAATIYLIAELLLSISLNKIRIVPIGIILIFATWIRLDNIFLSIPVAVITIYIHGFKKGIINGFLIALILGSSWGLWTIRNINVELPSLIPTDMIMPDGSRSPTGYLKWTKTWITHEYERPGALWGINRKNYNSIVIPNRAYNNSIEKQKVELLLKDLSKAHGKDFPLNIDNEFRNIATNKIKNYPFKYWIEYPLTRSLRMWTNPFSSFGWPNEMPDKGLSKEERLAAAKGNIDIIIQKIIEYPLHATSKLFNAIYRATLMVLLIYCFIKINFIRKKNYIYIFGLSTFLYMLGRTLFFSYNSNFETRYMLTTIPFIELFILLSIFSVFFHKRK